MTDPAPDAAPPAAPADSSQTSSRSGSGTAAQAPARDPAAVLASAPASSPEFTTAMVHLYRGEVARSNTWRGRLDATTNWAVVTTGAALTFAFGGVANPPVVLLIVTLLALLFLFIEARRYRYYELWTHRVRLMETNFYGSLLTPNAQARSDWREELYQSLRHPAFPITLLEALGRRYRRNYAPLFLILAVSWLVKVTIHPTPVGGWPEFLERAAVGPLPGWAALTVGVVFNGALIALGLFTVGLRRSDAEVFGEAPRAYKRLLVRLRAATREALEIDLGAFRPTWGDRRKQLVYIVSDRVQEVGRPLLQELDRGVTLIKGVGMYSGKEHGILMCVVTGRQADRLKEIVHRHDPRAFVVITGARDVRGEGFRPLEA